MLHAVVLAHPKPTSFCAALARTCVEHLRAGGHEAQLHDLYAMDFDPRLQAEEMPTPHGVTPAPDVVAERRRLSAVKSFIFVYPFWFNAPPAMVFMGDTGSLALGGALGAIAVAAHHEIVLAIVGGLFLLEALSVIIQVASFKLTKKRVFLMAPIHHHFEKLGWAESTVVIRFWIVAMMLSFVGLATLKLR